MHHEKIKILAAVLTLFLIQAMVFGNNYQKPDLYSKDDTAKKCSKINIVVKEIEAVKAMTVKATVLQQNFSKTGRVLSQIMSCILDNEIEMTGPPFARYHSWDPDGDTELEAGVPVTQKQNAKEMSNLWNFLPAK